MQSNDSVLVNLRRIYAMLIFFSQLDCPFLHSWILMILERSINWCHSSLTCSLLRLRFDIFLLGVVVSSRALPSSPSAIIDNHQSLTVSWETRWWQRAPNFNMADGPAEKEETILPASKLENKKSSTFVIQIDVYLYHKQSERVVLIWNFLNLHVYNFYF